MPTVASAARNAAILSCIAGALLVFITKAEAVDCTATVPASLVNERMAAEVSGQSCGAIKRRYAQTLGDQASLLAQLRPTYLRKLGTIVAPTPAAKASEVKAALKTYDADVGRLSAMADAIGALQLPPPTAKASAASASASASAAVPSLADRLRESSRLGKDLSDRVAKDIQDLNATEVGVYCRLDHHLQFGRAVHPKLLAACQATE